MAFYLEQPMADCGDFRGQSCETIFILRAVSAVFHSSLVTGPSMDAGGGTGILRELQKS